MQTESSKPKPNGHCKDMSLGQEQAFLSLPPGIKDLLTKPDEKILHNSIEGRRLTWNEQATWIIEWMIDNWHTPEDIYDVVRTSRLADEEFGDFDDVWLKQEIARRWKEIDELLRETLRHHRPSTRSFRTTRGKSCLGKRLSLELTSSRAGRLEALWKKRADCSCQAFHTPPRVATGCAPLSNV